MLSYQQFQQNDLADDHQHIHTVLATIAAKGKKAAGSSVRLDPPSGSVSPPEPSHPRPDPLAGLYRRISRSGEFWQEETSPHRHHPRNPSARRAGAYLQQRYQF